MVGEIKKRTVKIDVQEFQASIVGVGGVEESRSNVVEGGDLVADAVDTSWVLKWKWLLVGLRLEEQGRRGGKSERQSTCRAFKGRVEAGCC